MTAKVDKRPGCYSSVIMHNPATRRCVACAMFSECAVAVVEARKQLDALMASCKTATLPKRGRKPKGPAIISSEEFEIVLPTMSALSAVIATDEHAHTDAAPAMLMAEDFSPAAEPIGTPPDPAPTQPSTAPESIAPRPVCTSTSVTPRSSDLGRCARQFHDVFDSKQHNAMHPRSQTLLAWANRRFNGSNNGSIFITLTALRKFGFTCFTEETLATSLAELLAAGFLVVTRKRCGRRPATYALTWLLDRADPNFDRWKNIGTTSRKTKSSALPRLAKAA